MLFVLLADLFNSCQLHISYAKFVTLFLRSLIKEKVCQYLAGYMGGGSIMKKVTGGDIGGRGFYNLAFSR